MRTNLVMFRCLICIAFVGMAMMSFGAIPPMVAHWPLDNGSGTLVSEVVGGVNGTMVGLNPAQAWIPGKLGGAVRFDNTDAHRIEVPHAAAMDFGSGSFSVSLLVRYTTGTMSTDRWVIKGTHASPPASTGKRFEFYNTAGVEWRFSIDDNVTKTDLKMLDNAALVNGDWVHIVAVRDTVAREMRAYVGGNLAGTCADTVTTDISSGEVLFIGDSTDETNSAMSGDMDDIRLFNVALTPAQIAEIKMLYAPTPTPFVAGVDSQWMLYR